MPAAPAARYDARKALWLAAVCYQTYQQYADPHGNFVRPAGFETADVITAHSLNGVWEPFGFILASQDEIVVAFRGTSSTSDWLSDALAVQTEYSFVREAGLTHLGFTQIYRSAREQILTALERLRPGKRKRLYVTGHSLGGALSVLCAPDVAANSPFSSPILYSFGSPRVGDPAFVQAFAEQAGPSFRVSNLYDAVTYLPPTTLKLPRTGQIFEYRHIRSLETLEFSKGSMSANHVIGSYFDALAKRVPDYARALRAAEPGFCPGPAAGTEALSGSGGRR